MYPAVAIDQISQSQSGKETTANNAIDALSAAALFGIKSASGLNVTFYGGVFPIASTPTVIADQTVAMSANATNYVKSNSSGVVSKVTSAPTGWPGPLAGGDIALYELVTGSSTVTSGVNYLTGIGSPGPTGDTGAQGNPGSDFAGTRKHIFMPHGANTTTVTTLGFGNWSTVAGTATARALAATSLRESIPYLAYVTASGAGNSAQIYSNGDVCYFGNAAGRGGFTCAIRFCLESANAPANFRTFFGLIAGATTIGNVEPDTLVNVIGIGSKAADANLSIIHNDGSGTATMATLGANFPAIGTDNVYELLLQAVADTTTVTYTLTCADTGDTTSNSFSTDVPANTTFLRPVLWCNNGATVGGVAAFGVMQVLLETRY